jgi:hypothetical protein
MRKKLLAFVLTVVFGSLLAGIVHAQTEEITFSMSRDFGYSSGSGKIQGLFSMKASSTVPVTEVDFHIDSTIILADKEEPYKVQFNTDDYPIGVHNLYVVGITTNGKQIVSKEVKVFFVSAEESRKAALGIIVPVLGLVLVITIISVLVPAISSRKKGKLAPGETRHYGLAGGSICSRCKRPFALHMFAPNMLMGKLERCPHCRKWGVFRSFSIEKLREAEKAELEISGSQNGNHGVSDDEQLRKEIDDSRFQGM